MWLHSSSSTGSTSPPFLPTRPPPSHARSCMQNSLAGRVVIVTGANSGLGFEASKVRQPLLGLAQAAQVLMRPALLLSQAIAARGATLYMLCRNQQRGQEAADKVKQASGNSDVHLAVSARNLQCRSCSDRHVQI